MKISLHHFVRRCLCRSLLAALLLFPGVTLAQKCKFKIDKKDPLTGEHVLGEGINMGGGVGIGIAKVGSKPEIHITLTYPHDQSFKVEPGNLMIVKLANGDTLQYRNANTATPVTFVELPGTASRPPLIRSQYTLTYYVDQRFYQLLSKHLVELFRVYVNDQSVDVTVNGKAGKKIKKFSACLN